MDGPGDFPDHFSGQAALYASGRPPCPDGLFRWLAGLAPGRGLAWDCATGNGQAAAGLAPHFDRVVATDASADQLARAPARPNVEYRRALVERSGLEAASVDLTTVALAVHWFRLDEFYEEVRRVSRPGGVLACWTYHLPGVNREVDRVVERLRYEVLEGCWAPEIRLVEEGYRTLPFPFEEIDPGAFCVEQSWTMDQFAGHLRSWSGTGTFRERNGREAVDEVLDELSAAWGDPLAARTVAWQLGLRVGKVHPPARSGG